MLRKLLELFSRESLLDQAHADIITMLKEDNEMFGEAIRTLRHSDTAELRFDFQEKDRYINKLEREVRKKVITHLSVQQGFNISAALVITAIVHDVERIGDYCKNIAELASLHPKEMALGELEGGFQDIEKAISNRFDKTIKALEEIDVDIANTVLDEHPGITRFCDSVVRALVNEEISDLKPGEYASLALYARYLKRTASHLSNIASSIVNPFHRIGFRPKDKGNGVEELDS